MALFPPIVAASMPAFDIKQDNVKIYFTLSGYNSGKIEDIKLVQVSVRYQNSNLNALINENQILEKTDFLFDPIINKYYITLYQSDLKQGFKKDRLYKVQLRFCNTTTNIQTQNRSEWSTVCIIKAIEAPLFYIQQIDVEKKGVDSSVTDQNNFYSFFADFIMVYQQNQSSQILKSWRLRLLDNSFTRENLIDIDKYTYSDSGEIFVSANNYGVDPNNLVLKYSLPYEMQGSQNTFDSGPNYKLYVEILTKNGYAKSILYQFKYQPTQVNAFKEPIAFQTIINEQEGYIKLNFSSGDQDLLSNIVIRRTDSKSNFNKWEDLKIFTLTKNVNFSYYDFTVESGILYRYCVQQIDSRGRRGTPAYDQFKSENTGVMVEWNNAFLLQTGYDSITETLDQQKEELNKVSQLKLKYDFQISSYKTNISESKTDTIGSKYPYIRRNGNMYYRSFPVTGTITFNMDDANLFITDKQLYNNNKNNYLNFRGEVGNYSNMYDYTKERLFREKVEAFLYNSKPKLYKSMQQGNIFIKLMEVSLTPKNQLSRLIYTFSATAYQIDQACIDTYNKFGLINIGQYNPNLSETTTVMRQLSSYDVNNPQGYKVFKGGQDIVGADSTSAAFSNTIAKQIKYNQSFNRQIVNDFKITWLRLTIDSDPYLIIKDSNGEWRPLDDIKDDGNGYDSIENPINYPLYQIESTYNSQDIYLGHLFKINGQQIIISPPNNIYELKENDFSFGTNVQIIPAKDTIMSIDYRADITRVQDQSLVPKNIRIDYTNGQLKGTFNYNNNLIGQIKTKYNFSYGDQTSGKDSKIKKYLNGVKTLLIDTQPYTIVKIKTNNDINEEYTFIVNETGELNFDPHNDTTYITSFIVYGKNIPCKVDENNNLIAVEKNRSSINNPSHGVICKEDNNYYIYYNNKWYPCQKRVSNNYVTLDVKCPVDALIFYYATIRRDYY